MLLARHLLARVWRVGSPAAQQEVHKNRIAVGAACSALLFGAPAVAAVCIGNCGLSGGTDGVVTGGHRWVSSNGGVGGQGLGLGSETNGSTCVTDAFVANGTDELSLEFNYVTSDGGGYADYAFFQLLGGAGGPLTLFTARTTPGGNTVPGFGMPPIAPGVTLTPAATPIIPGGPVWSPLGVWSGRCYAGGCGYTGWIRMTFTPAAGTYRSASAW